MSAITIDQADCLDWLRERAGAIARGEAEAFDACVTDPPYHLTSIVKRFGGKGAAAARDRDGAFRRQSRGFMGKQWDGGDIAQRVETWELVLACLKPGAHLIAFSGTRTYHRMAVAIEDAGFEIRDQLAWAYGSGFPKSHDVAKAIDRSRGEVRQVRQVRQGDGSVYGLQHSGNVVDPDPITDAAREWQGWGTALKPAWEPIVLARAPLAEKSVAAQVLATGTGAINIDGCRVGNTGGTATRHGDKVARTVHAFGDGLGARGGVITKVDGLGRFPANLVHDGSDEVVSGFPETGGGRAGDRGDRPAMFLGGRLLPDGGIRGHDDDGGSASRFFYSAKAGPLDRIGSKHTTVKPVDLMRWLVRMVCPPGGTVLEPFAGSGTTGIACMAEGFGCAMIDIEAEHDADITRKLDWLRGEGRHSLIEHDRRLAHGEAAPAGDHAAHGPLFALAAGERGE